MYPTPTLCHICFIIIYIYISVCLCLSGETETERDRAERSCRHHVPWPPTHHCVFLKKKGMLLPNHHSFTLNPYAKFSVAPIISSIVCLFAGSGFDPQLCVAFNCCLLASFNLNLFLSLSVSFMTLAFFGESRSLASQNVPQQAGLLVPPAQVQVCVFDRNGRGHVGPPWYT